MKIKQLFCVLENLLYILTKTNELYLFTFIALIKEPYSLAQFQSSETSHFLTQLFCLSQNFHDFRFLENILEIPNYNSPGICDKKINFVAINKTLLYWLKMKVMKCPKRHIFFNPIFHEEFPINMLNN